MASCPCEPRYHPAFVAMDGHIYMGLGSSDFGDLGDWWITTWPPTLGAKSPAALPRHHPYQFGIDGIVYTGFGHSGEDIFNTWYAYDPSTETWSELAELPAEGAWPARNFPQRTRLCLERRRREPQLDGGRGILGLRPSHGRLVRVAHPQGGRAGHPPLL